MNSVWVKKVIASVCALSCALSFAACQSSNTQSAASEGESSKAPASSSTTEKIDPLGKYDETVTIKIGRELTTDFTYYGGETYDDNAWNKAYLDELNIKIETMWVVSDGEEADTKMNTGIASGDYPDVFLSTQDGYKSYIESGVIADVTSLYDDYLSENAKRYLASDDGVASEAATYQGKKYGIPTISNPYDAANVLWIRQDWLDALNLSAPTTVDELQTVAQAFTEQDPDGNGQKDTYAIAMTGKEIWSWFGGVGPFFEMYNAYPGSASSGYPLITDDSGKIVWGGASDGMKPALTALQNYYNNGWIAQDFGTMDTNKIISEIGSGAAGMFFAPMYGCMTVQNTLLKMNPDAKLIAVPLPGIDSDTPGKVYLSSSLYGINCVSSKCEHPEALFKLFNLGLEKVAYTDDPKTLAMFGGDNKNYSGAKLAVMDPTLPFKNYDNFKKVMEALSSGDTAMLNAEQQGYYDQIKDVYEDKPVDGSDATYVAAWGVYGVFGDPNGGYAAVDKLITNKNYVNTAYPVAPTDAMNEAASVLDDLVRTHLIKIIYGNEPVDTWDSVVDQWNSLGGATVLSDANDWAASNK